MYEPLKAFKAYVGPKAPLAVIVGEAWGKNESAMRQPFVGSSGKELFLMLGEAFKDTEPNLHFSIQEQFIYGDAWANIRGPWFEAAGIGLTNVFNFQPPGNKVHELCTSKKELGKDYDWPPLDKGKYLRPEFFPELDRLIEEIDTLSPNLVIACGNTACWALLQATKIGHIRGSVAMSHWNGKAVKVLPTYHPANVLYQWSQRTVVVADLMKAGREMKFPEIRRPRRRILVDPTIEEVERFTTDILAKARAGIPLELELAADTETMGGQITMISFAPAKDMAIVIPFIDQTKPGWSYWPTKELELRAWLCLKRLCECPCIRLVGQNFIYDMQYLWPATVKLARTPEDTMMLHHSLYPELNKGLGFLGSVYTDEASWKLMRRQKADTEKRDE